MSWNRGRRSINLQEQEGEFKRKELGSMPVGRDEVKVNVATSPQGNVTLDIRRWWMNDQDQWMPGKGVSIPIEKADQFKEMLDRAFAVMHRGKVNPDGEEA